MVNRVALDIFAPATPSKLPVLETAMLWNFWKLCRISLARETVGYEYRVIPEAQDFFENQILINYTQNNVSNFENNLNQNAKSTLFSYFVAKECGISGAKRAAAGLCLRCNVSYPILKACKKIDSLFGGEKRFTYNDLLPFVLNDDDGKTLIVLDARAKTQLVLDDNGRTKPTNYKFFTVEVLRTFKPDSQSSMSLDNWAYLQTKQNQEVKNFLSEFGFKHQSDWAILNRARPKQIESLSERDRQLINVFHAVYRRDRREHRSAGVQKCPDPSNSQLQEMLTALQKQNVTVKSNLELIAELKQVAVQLKQYDVWSSREPLEIRDPDTGKDVLRPDLPHASTDQLNVEQQEILEFLHQQLKSALIQSIEQEISACIAKLEKSKSYAIFAQKFMPGLQLYYCQGMSLKEIVPLLEMSSWDQARRVLDPGKLINNVRARTVEKVLDSTMALAQEKGLTQIPPEPEYLKTLIEQIEAFADVEFFKEAAEEIKAGKNREMNSLYARQLRVYFSNILPPKKKVK
ncbi:hypothetical protein [Microcoleus sp. herbarium14]|uniref:hypothetical protein n=1 Tax=Microcoleus sp. herbarium14 TaxID=3055439 RepID=UPI002FD1BBE8